MGYKLGDLATVDFTTHNPFTGNVSDADVTPTCAVFEDANDTPILTPTVVRRFGYVGDYRVSIIIAASTGFEVGKTYNVVVTAQVAAVTARATVLTFNLQVPTPVDEDTLIRIAKAVRQETFRGV